MTTYDITTERLYDYILNATTPPDDVINKFIQKYYTNIDIICQACEDWITIIRTVPTGLLSVLNTKNYIGEWPEELHTKIQNGLYKLCLVSYDWFDRVPVEMLRLLDKDVSNMLSETIDLCGYP